MHSARGYFTLTVHLIRGLQMPSVKHTAAEALTRGRRNALRMGKVAKSATVKAAKVGAQAALAAGAAEFEKGWSETDPVKTTRRRRAKVAAMVAGAAAVTAVGIAVARHRNGKGTLTNGARKVASKVRRAT
jgi:hypothetical protein